MTPDEGLHTVRAELDARWKAPSRILPLFYLLLWAPGGVMPVSVATRPCR